MATYFGEVLPVSSRAVDEDEEFEDEFIAANSQKERDVVLRWGSRVEKTPDDKLVCQSVIVGVGRVACGFVQRHYLTRTDQPIGTICCGLDADDHNTLSQQKLTDSSCFIYRIKKGNSSALIVLWHHSATPYQQFSVTNKLFEDLVPGSFDVYVITSSHVSEYKTADRDGFDVPLVRCLTTDARSDEGLLFPKLEVPNIVTGLSANVLTHCQVHGIGATLFLGYVEVDTADSINLDAFLPLTTLQSLSKFLKDPSSEVFRHPAPPVKDRGHLYI